MRPHASQCPVWVISRVTKCGLLLKERQNRRHGAIPGVPLIPGETLCSEAKRDQPRFKGATCRPRGRRVGAISKNIFCASRRDASFLLFIEGYRPSALGAMRSA
jgi:hypothetical protein